MPGRRVARGLGLALAASLALVVAAEVALQIAARFADDRAGAWRPGAEVRVLAVGDSHTYGAYVDEAASYPAQLQALLDARWPGRFSVINLGIPGLSSTQVRERLAVHVARYEPDVVVVWAGSNNAWNRVRADAPPSLEGLAQRSRLYRLVRVWLHDRALERWPSDTRADGRHQASDVDLRVEGSQSWSLRHGGIVETLRNERAPAVADDAMEERAYRDYRAIADWLRRAGIELVLVQYPLETGAYGRANRAMRRAAAAADVPLVDSPAALARVPEDRRRWEQGRHPSGPIYREIAAELVPLLEAR